MYKNDDIEFSSEMFKSFKKNNMAIVSFTKQLLEISINLRSQRKLFSILTKVNNSPNIKGIIFILSPNSLSAKLHKNFLLKTARKKTTSNSSWHQSDSDLNYTRHINMLHHLILDLAGYNKITAVVFQGEVSLTFLGPALFCDMRFASEDVVFKPTFLELGIPPSGGLGFILPKYVGHGKASELLLFNKSHSAVEMKRLDLLNEIIESESIIDESIRKIGDLTPTIPGSIKHLKKMLNYPEIKLQRYLESELCYWERGLSQLKRGKIDTEAS